MPRQKKDSDEMSTTRIIQSNKWAKASVRATQLKCLLDAIMNEFSEEEKQSKKYRQLIETVDFHFGQVLKEYTKITGSQRVITDPNVELELLKKKSSLLGWRTVIIAGIGMAGLKIFEWLIALIFTWITSGGKTP